MYISMWGAWRGGLEFAAIAHWLFINSLTKREVNILGAKYTMYVLYVYIYDFSIFLQSLNQKMFRYIGEYNFFP